MDEAHLHRRAAPLEMLLDRLGVSVQIDENFCDAGTGAEIEPDIEQRAATNRHQALGDGVGEGTQARSMSSGQQKGFQGCPRCFRYLLLSARSSAGQNLKRPRLKVAERSIAYRRA